MKQKDATALELDRLKVEIAELKKQNKKLRDALGPFACLGRNEFRAGDFNRARRALGLGARSVTRIATMYFSPPTKGYKDALSIMVWCEGQERHVAPDYVQRMWAAAIAAWLDAKDDTIRRLIKKLAAYEHNLGFPWD